MKFGQGKFKKFNVKKHKTLVICFSLILAVILQLVIYNITKSTNKENTIQVLIAKSEIKEDTEVTMDMYTKANIRPIKGVEYATESELSKYKTDSKILQGEAITKGRLKTSDTKNEDNKILYSLKLDPSDAVAGTLRSGDKVNILSATASNGAGIANYLFEEGSNVPVNINVKAVYDANLVEIMDSRTPASTIVLELDENQAPALRVAELAKNVKLILAKKQ